MRPFYDVSSTAQFCRRRGMAVQALAAYELGDISVAPLCYSQKATNRSKSSGRRIIISLRGSAIPDDRRP